MLRKLAVGLCTIALAVVSLSTPQAAQAAAPRPHRPEVWVASVSPIYWLLPYSEEEPPPTGPRYPATDVTLKARCTASGPDEIFRVAFWTGTAYQDGRQVPAAWWGGLGQGEDYCTNGTTQQTFNFYRDARPYVHPGWMRVEVRVYNRYVENDETVFSKWVWVPKARR